MTALVRRFLYAAALGLCALRSQAAEVDLHGAVSARAVQADGRTSWLAGGFGRLGEGGTGTVVRGEAQLGLDWTPSATWLLHVHAVAHGEPSAYAGRRAGVAEAFLQYRPELTPVTALRFRAGFFFPPTSFENTDPLWQSPYTVTLSALNTWIGEEVRPAGVESALQLSGDRSRVEIAATAFVAGDPAGALLGWRGWAFGDRLSTAGEVLPLPPLQSFRDGGAFDGQRDGTRPFDELDSRPGYAARLRATIGAVRVQGAYTDNRGDRRLERGQYSWRTRFGQAGLEVRPGAGLTLVAEAALGDTGMGPAFAGGPQVQVRFRTGYALASWTGGAWRISARVDGFDDDDRDGTADPDGESGWAMTAAAFWRPSPAIRVGLEFVDVRAARPAAGASDGDDRRGLIEVRLAF